MAAVDDKGGMAIRVTDQAGEGAVLGAARCRVCRRNDREPEMGASWRASSTSPARWRCAEPSRARQRPLVLTTGSLRQVVPGPAV